MSDSVDEVDHSMIDVGNDTTYLDGTQFEDVKRTLLDEFSTPVKPASSSGKTNNEAPEEHMKVYLRIRPFTQKEITKGENQGCMGVDNVNCLVTKAPKDSHTYKNSKHGGKTNHHFTFSKIFDASTTQKMFFDETVLNTVKDFIDGTNCLIFTYGVTNSGKTYTIQGLPSDGGILPRSLDVIFNSISDQQWHNMSLKPKMFADVTRLTPLQEELEHKIKEGVLKMAIPADEPDISSLMGDSDSSRLSLASTLSQDSLMMPPPVKRGRLTGSIGDKQEPVTEKETDDKAQLENVLAEAEQRVREEASVSVEMQGRIRFSVWVSYIEIYNEYIYDLLEPLPKKKNAKRPCLQLREDGNGVPYAKGVKEINVTSADEAYKIMTIGKQNLQMACTKLNHNSSRSHCIFTVKMLRVVDKDDPHMARISMLSFCDLAGSERYGKTGSMGDRIKEAGNINTSLLTLGRCIKVLRHNQLQRKRPIEFRDHPQIVPFRESKLTRQFQSFFCGKGKAAMIVNVNQNASTFDETLHALKYSAIAKQVVVVQEAPKEPPPRKKLKAASQGPRSHRLISMALAPSPGNSRSRATIGWATPGTMAKDMVEMEEQAMNLPLPVENTDELLEIDEEDEENCVENIDPEREQQLIDIIMKLKDALAAERRRIKTLDGDIRSEIASEMAQQLVRIETEYEEKLREEREIAEEMADKRIELYMQSVKKCKKRKRLVEEEEEEYIPSIQFHQEKIKVGELEDKVADLQKDLDEAKAHLKVVIEERDDLQKENTKVTFDIAELKSHLEKKQTSNVGTPSRDDLCHKEVVLKMQAQLQQLREDLQTKEKEVEELTETLAEAGETFQQKEGVISQLEKEMSELEKLHTESQEALTDASQRLLSKLEYIQELEGKVHQDQENKECTNCQEQVSQMSTLIAKLADTESTVEAKESLEKELKAQLEDLKKVMDEKQCEVESLKKDVERFTKEVDEGQREVVSLREMLEKGQDSEESQVSALLQQLSQVQAELRQARDESASLAATNVELKQGMKKCETAMMDSEITISEMKKEVSVVSRKMDEVRQEEKATREQLEKQIEELEVEVKAVSEELAKKESKLQEDNRRSVKLEDRLEALEQSLQAANAAVRDKTIEAQKLQEELEKLSDREEGSSTKSEELSKQLDQTSQALDSAEKLMASLKQDLTELQEKLQQHEDCEQRIEALHKQLDDYILKVNEQADEIGEVNDKAKEEATKLEQCKLKRDEFEKCCVEKEGEVISLKNKIDDLQTRLNSERKQQKEANGELDGVLQGKAVLIEELNSKLSTLTSKLQWKQKELDQAKEETSEIVKQGAQYQKQIKQSTEEINNLKDAINTAKTNETELISQLEEARNLLAGVKEQAATLESAADIMQKKDSVSNIASEQLNQKIKDLEIDATEGALKITQLEEKLAQTTDTLELSEKKVSVLEDKVRELQGLAEKGGAGSDEENESLKKKVRELEGLVSEAEYKAQMTSRQLRREKTQVENRLKEKEEEYLEVEKQLSEMKQKISGLEHGNGQETAELEKQLRDQTERTQRLDAVIKDLEECLTSSKKAQDETLEHAERYKIKCRDLEEKVASKEDTILNLEKDLQETKDDKEQVNKRWRDEIDTQSDTVSDLEHKCKEYLAQVEMLKGKLSNIQMLEEKNDSILHELESRDDRIRELLQMLEEQEKKCSAMEMEKNQLRQKLDEMSQEQEIKMEKMTEKSAGLLTELQDVKSQLKEAQRVLGEKEKKYSELQKEFSILQDKLTAKYAKIKDMEQQIEDTDSKYKMAVEDKSSMIKDLQEELTSLKSEKEKICETLEEKSKLIDTLVSEKESEKIKDSDKVTEITKELEIAKSGQSELEEKLQEMEKSVHEMEQKLKVKTEEFQEAEKCRDVEKQELVKQVESRETSVEGYKKQMQLLKEEITILAAQVEKLSSSEGATRDTLTAVREELTEKEARISLLKEELATSRNKADEHQNLVDDLQKGQEREDKLRKELQESAQRLEEQNVKFNLQTDKLKAAQEAQEKQEKMVKDLKFSLASVQEELSSVQHKEKTSHQEMEVELRRTKRELQKREDQVEDLKSELDQKEKKLKQRITSITDLLSKMEAEKNSYEITVRDHKLNERVIEEMKSAMEEQEATMEAQDKVLQGKEEEIQLLRKDIDEQCTKYESLLKSSAGQGSSLRELESRCQQAERQAKLAEDQIKDSKRAADKAEKDRARVERDLQDTNKELSQMEKVLSETRHECQQMKEEKSHLSQATYQAEQMKKASDDKEHKMALLKQKFASMEARCQELEEEANSLKSAAKAADEKKQEELQKWREDRDKLVKQLESILKEKESQIKDLKKENVMVKQEPQEESDIIRQLRIDLMDREETIKTLSQHLDVRTPSRKSRRMTKGRTPAKTEEDSRSSTESLRKEVETLYRQLDDERLIHRESMGKAIKAKDEIISDLKQTNNQLQMRVPLTPKISDQIEQSGRVPETPGSSTDFFHTTELSTTGKKRGRPRKRKSSESSELSTDGGSRKKHQSSKRNQKSMQLQVSFSENDPMGILTIQEENTVDLDKQSNGTRHALADTLNTSGSFPSENRVGPRKTSRGPTFVLEQNKEPEVPPRRKKTKLRNTANEMLKDSPPVTSKDTMSTAPKPDAHKIVTRQLRTRRKASTAV